METFGMAEIKEHCAVDSVLPDVQEAEVPLGAACRSPSMYFKLTVKVKFMCMWKKMSSSSALLTAAVEILRCKGRSIDQFTLEGVCSWSSLKPVLHKRKLRSRGNRSWRRCAEDAGPEFGIRFFHGDMAVISPLIDLDSKRLLPSTLPFLNPASQEQEQKSFFH
ncbi:hypothetical protein J6590_036215 [Homalodisca vitripennis]|nr:hypothetical protein J6590_036215 [Homalodisca vitripennis]